jgi:hypothetical protein
VSAEAKSAIAKNQYVFQFSPSAGTGWVACSMSVPHGAGRTKSAIRSTTSRRPARPKMRSRFSNFTRHRASHNTTATSGTQTRYGNELSSWRASATPPISAASVSIVTR